LEASFSQSFFGANIPMRCTIPYFGGWVNALVTMIWGEIKIMSVNTARAVTIIFNFYFGLDLLWTDASCTWATEITITVHIKVTRSRLRIETM
jgi:hypothetical protein